MIDGHQDDTEEDIKAKSMDDGQFANGVKSSEGGLLSVIIHQAQELEGKHHTNPFVEVNFRGDKKKTPVSSNYGYFTFNLIFLCLK